MRLAPFRFSSILLLLPAVVLLAAGWLTGWPDLRGGQTAGSLPLQMDGAVDAEVELSSEPHLATAATTSPPSRQAERRTDSLPMIRDPFYAFVVGIAEADSLGLWTRRDLQHFVTRFGRESQLPLQHFLSLERRAVDTTAAESRRGISVQRTWTLTLSEPLNYPMPYRILGRNIGSLSVARVLKFSEWRLGSCQVYAPAEDDITAEAVTGLTVFRLDSGWIVMDVSDVLDKLLGGKLDDCWTQGFAICRQDELVYGLALSRNREMRAMCGEIDFATNEITAMGRPLARGVAVYVRPWMAPPEGAAGRIWQYEP